MHILVTNDDGVRHPGLAILAASLRDIGRVTVLAPDRNWSASGHVKTMHKPLRVSEAELADGSPAMASNGAPSDCVALALMGVVVDPVDVVVSGINPYANVGHDITYSGTVTAAMEAAIAGVPGIAVSVERPSDDGYRRAAELAVRITALAVASGLPPLTLLNLNLPIGEPKGVIVTRQGTRTYLDELDRRLDPRGEPYYWIGGEPLETPAEEGSDIRALQDGYASVTPIQLDLTAYDLRETLRTWQIE